MDGFMMPCCMHWDPQTLGHSNLSETSFAQAFGSQPVQAFLDGYMRTSPNFCARCSENVRCLAAGNG
ncbi:SPASM domain-containing protein [Methylogaea oryzae]|uniref:SPASM domain-containing protein n=1 Tax=Methylogaea oryzae TaxID=1295382 RepID=UPI0006D12D18|nr:hypothetical protein [Methylogaea oryzae]